MTKNLCFYKGVDHKAPSLQVSHEFVLSQRGKRVLGEEQAGLIGRSLNYVWMRRDNIYRKSLAIIFGRDSQATLLPSDRQLQVFEHFLHCYRITVGKPNYRRQCQIFSTHDVLLFLASIF